jgi:hypothetical protein
MIEADLYGPCQPDPYDVTTFFEYSARNAGILKRFKINLFARSKIHEYLEDCYAAEGLVLPARPMPPRPEREPLVRHAGLTFDARMPIKREIKMAQRSNARFRCA